MSLPISKCSHHKKCKTFEKSTKYSVEPFKPVISKATSESNQKLTTFGELLNSAYGVLKLILEQLEWSDLIQASRVCQTWSKVAKRISDSRCDPYWFYLKESLRTKTFGFVYNTVKRYTQPKLCLVFMNERANYAHCCLQMPRNACEKPCGSHHRFIQYLDFILTKSECDILTVCCSGVKSSFYPLCTTELNKEPCRSDKPSMLGTLIPQIPNVKISTFILNNVKDYSELIPKHVGDTNYVKCLLTFLSVKDGSASHQFILIQKLLNEINKHQSGEPFALGGGIVYGVKKEEFEQCVDRGGGQVACVTFSVPKSEPVDFEASSVLLYEDADDEETINSVFKPLAEQTVQRQHTLAFRFACVSRYDKTSLELKCYNRWFPKTPLIGFEGLGEIGILCVPPNADEPTECKRIRLDYSEIRHENSTIIVLLSWGKKVPCHKK